MEDGRLDSGDHRAPDDLPKRVFEKDAPRVKGDVETLCRLTESPEPPRRLIRSDNKVAMVRYGFGDASGAGFGSSLLVGDQLHYRTGTWIQSISDESSNYRELRNLVDAIDQAANEGVLQGAEVFMFTDNTTAEGAFFRGTSSVKPLFELVVRLKTLELRGEFQLHMIHVAGTRMIAQGTDGLSRGNIGEGVMAGEAMASFVPLHQTAIEREPRVLEWIREWIGDNTIHPLSPEGWFDQGHGITGHTRTSSGVWLPTREVGTHLWSPPPAAADVAVEEMLRARHKDPSSMHVFVVPKLMTYKWRKRLYKEADVSFEVPVGTYFWGKPMFEKLIIAIVFPILDASPWRLKRTPAVLALEGQLPEMWEQHAWNTKFVLRELRRLSERLGRVPRDMVRSLLFQE
jgi:hypothetical protein